MHLTWFAVVFWFFDVKQKIPHWHIQQCTKDNVTRAETTQPKMPDCEKQSKTMRSDSLSVHRIALSIKFLMFFLGSLCLSLSFALVRTDQPANEQSNGSAKSGKFMDASSFSFRSACIEEPTRSETIVFIPIQFYAIQRRNIMGNARDANALVVFCYLWWRWKTRSSISQGKYLYTDYITQLYFFSQFSVIIVCLE